VIFQEKQDCIESIIKILERTSAWRKAISVNFPDDTRNMKAAHTLDSLAVEATNLTDEQWAELQPHFSWSSERWRNALSHSARGVGFHYRSKDLKFFAKALIEQLSLSSSVWLFNLEDDMTELRRRVSAAMIHYGIKPEDIGDRLLIDGEKSLLITKTDHKGTKINVPVVDAVVEAIDGLEIDVLIVDPFISSHDGQESDSGAMDLVMKSGWVRVARDGNCAVELCHHTTKTDSSSGMATAMSGRGSGAVVFACRSVVVLNPMSPEDAKRAGLESPAGYFSAVDDKENLTPQTRLREWYKMVGVSLGNGGSKGNLAEFRSDNIGVVTRYIWPSNASFTEDVTGQQLQAILNRLKLGEHRKDGHSEWQPGGIVLPR
jgi:hypothetical protein